jgi:hypothetical protein
VRRVKRWPRSTVLDDAIEGMDGTQKEKRKGKCGRGKEIKEKGNRRLKKMNDQGGRDGTEKEAARFGWKVRIRKEMKDID